jgi:hypothetical protein
MKTIQQREVESRGGFDFVWFSFFNLPEGAEVGHNCNVVSHMTDTECERQTADSYAEMEALMEAKFNPTAIPEGIDIEELAEKVYWALWRERDVVSPEERNFVLGLLDNLKSTND